MIKDFIRDLTDKVLLSSGLQSGIDAQIVYSVERPSNPKFGDLSTNVSMVYAKKEKKSPFDIASKLIDFYPNVITVDQALTSLSQRGQNLLSL